MPEQAHFRYEANPKNIVIPSGPAVRKEIEVEDISFLMPIRIKCKIDGNPSLILGGMNYATREMVIDTLLPEDTKKELHEKVFEFLKFATTLPEEAYQASDEVYQQADRANREYETMHRENVGGL